MHRIPPEFRLSMCLLLRKIGILSLRLVVMAQAPVSDIS